MVLTDAKNIYTNFTVPCNIIFRGILTRYETVQIFEVKPELFNQFLSKVGWSIANTHVFKM